MSQHRRWHHMNELPVFLWCRGCDKRERVSEAMHTQVHLGILQSGWKVTKEHGMLCPSCAKNGVPDGLMTMEKLADLIKQQWNLTYVRPTGQKDNTYFFAAAGMGVLRPLSITVQREENTYHVTLFDGQEKPLGNLNIA